MNDEAYLILIETISHLAEISKGSNEKIESVIDELERLLPLLRDRPSRFALKPKVQEFEPDPACDIPRDLFGPQN